MVKVIWHKAALLQQMDGWIIFARLRQCALPWGHNGASWLIQWQIIRFSCFCTAHSRKSLHFTMEDLFAQNCLFRWGDLNSHLTHDSLGPSKPSTQTVFQSVQPFFCTDYHRVSLYLQWEAPLPSQKLPPPMGGSAPHLIHGSLRHPSVQHHRNNIDLLSKSNPLCCRRINYDALTWRRRRGRQKTNIKSLWTFNKNSCDLLTAITHTKILVGYFIICDKKTSISAALRQ